MNPASWLPLAAGAPSRNLPVTSLHFRVICCKEYGSEKKSIWARETGPNRLLISALANRRWPRVFPGLRLVLRGGPLPGGVGAELGVLRVQQRRVDRRSRYQCNMPINTSTCGILPAACFFNSKEGSTNTQQSISHVYLRPNFNEILFRHVKRRL